jgi:3-oxoacyl-[acyl-carrier protein] reductase
MSTGNSVTEFEGKTALITGGSRGIGRSIALAFAKAGARTAIVYSSSDAAAEETLAEIKKLNPNVPHGLYKVNVASTSLVEDLMARIKEELGGPHYVINNAGVTKDQLLLRMKEEDWDQVLNTNLKSVFNCTKAAMKIMLRERSGSIVNITSVIGQTGQAGQSNYAASKAGIIGFTKSAALEVASRNIRINSIAPGFIRSDMTEALTAEQKQKILAQVPMGQMGEPEDIAQACLFLCSNNARYITGHTLNVNGGIFMN